MVIGARRKNVIANETEKAMKVIKGKEKDGGGKYPAVSEFITCPVCGFEMDIWSDEEETRCIICGYRFFKRETTVH
jgi:rubrerythrin